MVHEIHAAKSFRITAPYTIEIEFEDGVRRTINFLPLLKGEVYGPLKNLDFFNRVKLDTEAKTIVWPNGADFDPALLYHWEQHVEELTQRAKKWEAQKA